MKHKTAELNGAMLDAAVAKARGLDFHIAPRRVWGDGSITIVSPNPVCIVGANFFDPSSNWGHGGPIIDRERIGTDHEDGLDPEKAWHAQLVHDARSDGTQLSFASGRTPLIAAMRAFVVSKFGGEVDLP